MLYISLILVVAGIALIVYSLLSPKEKFSSTPEDRFMPSVESSEMHSVSGTLRSKEVISEREPPISKKIVPERSGEPRTRIDECGRLTEKNQKEWPGKPALADVKNSIENLDRKDLNEDPGEMGLPIPVSEEGDDNEYEKQKEIVEEDYSIEGDIADEDSAEREPIEKTADNRDEIHQDKNYAVLFEDASNIIDYDNDENIIDPTLKEYKNIRRIGRGNIEIVKEGINFYIEKKFFRFDFYRISDIKVGERYLALFIKGSDAARVFLFEGDNSFKNDVNNSYQNFLRKAL